MEEERSKGLVCVTGGAGFIASWLIMRLLQHGYSVRTTIRSDPDCKEDGSFLTDLPGASERLQIFGADLKEPESFAPAIEGCSGVFHVAHPMDLTGNETEETITQRSINGALGLLQSCLHSKTVRRVIYTSSAYAVGYNDEGLNLLDENSRTDVDFVRSLSLGSATYIISKALTERAVSEFAETHGMDVVVLIPSMVTGPFICPHYPPSVATSLAMLTGNQEQYKYINNALMVHVDDVASAYIFLFEYPDAKGRYICSGVNVTIEELINFVSAKYPEYQVPPVDGLKIEGFKLAHFSSKKLLDSGFKFKHGLHEIYDQTIRFCKGKGLL